MTDTIEIHVPVLQRGKGPERPVVRVQHMLNDRGYGPLAEDGDFGPKTEAAVKRFQANDGIEQTGRVGPKTWPALLTEWLLSSEAS